MGSDAASDIVFPPGGKAEGPEATVEIKIKTLDSQTYTLRVNKCVPVPALKEQIAGVTGVLSEQQRLICQGKVLKDDQLLSAYHVEDGHTLHLVSRQPAASSSSHTSDSGLGSDSIPTIPENSTFHVGHSFTFETLNLADQRDSSAPYISRILSSVLSSLGLGNVTRGSATENDSEGHGGMFGNGAPSDPSWSQEDQFARDGFQFSGALPLQNQLPRVIPDSLTTLSQYLSHLRHEFGYNGRVPTGSSQVGDIHNGEDEGQGHNSHSQSTARQGLPTPASLAEVILSARPLLIENAGECLSELAAQLQGQERVVDPRIRADIQNSAMTSGLLFQNLGTLLLELGRTITTLRMGQTPAEAVVSAGPAIFLSALGPNPIMVQAGPNFSGIPMGAIPHGGVASGLESGLLPRSLDIRIHRVAEQSERQQPSGDTAVHHAFQWESGNGHATQESSIRIVPIRTVLAIPARVSRAPSDSPSGRIGLQSSVLTRILQRNHGNTHAASQASSDRITSRPDPHPIPGSLLQTYLESRNPATIQDQNLLSTSSSAGDSLRSAVFEFVEHEEGDLQPSGSSGQTAVDISCQDPEEQPSGPESSLPLFDGFNQSFGTIDSASNEQIQFTSGGLEELATGVAPSRTGTDADPEEQNVRRHDDGVLFSAIVHQLMPFITQTTAAEQSTDPSSIASTSMDHTERPNSAETRNRCSPSDDPASKRRKME